MRSIFLNRFYWPDEPATAQLLTDLAESLAARGLDVTVITSHPDKTMVARTEVRHGVRIIRVGSSRSTGGSVILKALDFATFHVAALWRLLFVGRRGDAIVAMTDPPLIGIGVWFVAGLCRARLFHWVQDIYPELAIALSGNSSLRVLRPVRNLAWRRAEGCVTLGQDMKAVLSQAGVSIEKIFVAPNWAPAGLVPASADAIAELRVEWGLQEKFVVAYSGNLGRVHDLDPVLEVARELQTDARIEFVFVGGGARKPALETATSRDRLTNVQFRSAQPRARLSQALSIGDVHLVTVLPGCECYVFPSKLYGILAVGRPVIFIGPLGCDVARTVTAHQFGFAFDRRDFAGIVGAIRALAADRGKCDSLGANARRFAFESGGLAAAADRWQTLLTLPQACGDSRRRLSCSQT